MVDKEIKRKLRRIWCERLVISLCLPVALGFSVVKVQAVHNNVVNQEQARTLVRQMEREREMEMDRGLALTPESDRKRILAQAQKQAKLEQAKLQQESLFLGVSALCFTVMLMLLLRQRNRISLTLTGQLICFFPEECIAELEARHEQMKSEQRSIWFIRRTMLEDFLGLLRASVQINIENLWLPQHRGHKNIDAQNSYMDSVDDDEEYKRYIWAMIRTRKFQ